MKNKKNVQPRWTVVNMEISVKDFIIAYAEDNGYTVARALKELTKKELKKWRNKEQ